MWGTCIFAGGIMGTTIAVCVDSVSIVWTLFLWTNLQRLYGRLICENSLWYLVDLRSKLAGIVNAGIWTRIARFRPHIFIGWVVTFERSQFISKQDELVKSIWNTFCSWLFHQKIYFIYESIFEYLPKIASSVSDLLSESPMPSLPNT